MIQPKLETSTNIIWLSCWTLFLLFLGLKLANLGRVAHWNWLIVVAPILTPLILGALVASWQTVAFAWKSTAKKSEEEESL